MPLLGNRPHILNATAKKSKKAGEEAPTYQYVVPETKEICSSEDELKRKITIYEAKIWTCRVTGRANLTYKEAVKSERDNLNLLKQSVSDYHRGPILQIVHKNSSSLEPLTNECWTRVHEQFAVGEPVLLNVDANKPISAIVVGVEAINKVEEIDLTKDETSSPNNSDKENNGGSKRPPLLKDTFSYSVKIDSDEPIKVNNVPSKSMQRVHRPPSKDHIRMFIRAHAMRYGPSSSGPWIVDMSSLKKYCPKLKIFNNLVDKDKLRLLSETFEVKFYEKIVSELSKGNNVSGETTIKLSPKSLKVFKNISALRDESPVKASFDSPTSVKTKESPEGRASKKMKQAVLPFNKSECSPSTRKIKSGTPTKPESTLPYIAKRLIRLLKGKPDATVLKKMIIRCADVLTDPQIRALPDNARKLVIDKKIAMEHRKRMQNMTPEQQKAYLRHLRQQRRLLIDENAPFLETEVEVKPLPEPRAVSLPSNMTALQFSRVLSFTEFIACYQPLLTEGALSPGELLYPTQVKKLAEDMCQSMEGGQQGEEEEFTTDVEEESALTSTDAGLPKASIQGLRSLSLDRTLRAVVEPHMSASAYRCLTRPMSAILRLLFLSEQYSKQTELGIQLSKIPITPYTAPELLRLLLSCELAKGTCSTNDIAVDRIRQIVTSSDGNADYLKPPKDALGASSLFKHLSSTDLFALDTEHRILAIEILVELMLDFDTVDEYLHTCDKKAIQATKERLALSKRKRTVIPPELKEEKVQIQKVVSEPELDDLASIVKSRRVLAAKAAEEREMREAKERQRRELEAKVEAEEKALSKAEHDQTVATTESKLAFRASSLGTDRRDRRYWHFFCAPNRLFVESNWAPEDHRVGESLIIDSGVAASSPPSYLFPEGFFATLEPVHRFGYAAHSKWFVLDQAEELDALANALVEKGVRESQLKRNLVQSGLLESLKELIALTKVEKSPTHGPMEVEPASKSADALTIEKITAKTRGDAQAILANVLLKNVYETEIHLRDGGLGGVPDFPAWMANILAIQAQFGLCFCLTGNVPSTPVKEPPHVVHAPSPSALESAVSTSAPVPKTPLQSAAEVLLSVGLNVHRRFLSVPKIRLREMINKSGDYEEDDIEENSHQEVDEKQQRLERTVKESDVELWIDAWMNAVRSASTLSRLNVLHACLDACILWEKSVANVRCRICRRNKDDESLLLCDGCNAGFHLYCLRPPLHSIPRGDWFCASCKPQTSRSKATTAASTSRQRRDRCGRDEVSEPSDSEESRNSATSGSEGESCSLEEGEGHQRMRVTRSRTRHLSSAKKTVSRSSSQSSLQSKTFTKTPSNVNDIICLVCDEEGTRGDELVGCSTCPNAFHLNCHNPPLRSANRRAPWVCSVCRLGRSFSGGLSAIGQSLRLRVHSRINRKNSYARLHKFSPTPKKRPRPVSLSEESEENGSASEGSFNDEVDVEATASGDDLNEGEEEEEDEEEADNDTETTEEQAEERDFQPPPAKRPRVATGKPFSCADLIAAVRRHRNSWPFQEPVDPDEVADYYEIVVDPVDLSMVTNWLKSGRYDGDNGPQRLAEDLAKMFFNAELYNSADSDVWKAGSQLEVYVQNLFKKFSPPVEYKRDPLN